MAIVLLNSKIFYSSCLFMGCFFVINTFFHYHDIHTGDRYFLTPMYALAAFLCASAFLDLFSSPIYFSYAVFTSSLVFLLVNDALVYCHHGLLYSLKVIFQEEKSEVAALTLVSLQMWIIFWWVSQNLVDRDLSFPSESGTLRKFQSSLALYFAMMLSVLIIIAAFIFSFNPFGTFNNKC